MVSKSCIWVFSVRARDRRMSSQWKQLLLLFLLHVFSKEACGVGIFEDMGLPEDDLYQPGDLVLGGMFPLNKRNPGSLCGTRISQISILGVQGMIYMINQVNRDPNLLPNISLGFAILNDCQTEKVALVRSTQFLPLSQQWSKEITDRNYPKEDMWNGTNVDRIDDNKAIGNKRRVENTPLEIQQYKVVGIVGPYSSAFSVVTSPLLSFYRIPHISWIATSDQLTNKERYPYFSRVVPADRFQAKAIVDVIVHFNWTYISALYSQGSYGSTGIRYVMQEARDKAICVAYTSELRSDFLNADYDHIVKNLVENYRAKVVVLFTESGYARRFMYAIERAGVQGKFIFLASEGFTPSVLRRLEHLALNILSLTIPGGPFISNDWGDRGFETYYRSLNPWNNATGSKWFGQYVPTDVGCSWEADENGTDWCGSYKNLSDFPNFKFTNWPVRVMDCVKTFALAINATIREYCPDAYHNKSLLDSCINGERLQKNILNIEFLGYSTNVKFNADGDLKGSKYMVMLHSYTNSAFHFKGVGLWDYETRTLDLNDTDLIWFDSRNGTIEEVPWVPESVCAKPCNPGQFLIQGELACCWECHPCLEDQVVRPDGKGCEFCEDTTWPNQENFTECEPIPPSYLRWTHPMAIGLVSVNCLTIFIVTIITFVFILKRDKKIIKGSSRELMAPILTGLFLAYLIVLTYITKPTTWTCYISYFGFHLSCSFIFVPLFLKTLRVYQIFKAAEKCQQEVRCGDIKSLMILLAMIMTIQVGVTTAVCAVYPISASLSMPVKRVRFVELSCQSNSHLTILGPLTFNLLFVLLTAIFGFLTRQLPDNFNESWHIFISVTTTFIIWLAFLPTYFITFYAYHRAALLALALILNGAITSLCLFGPKLYAVFFVNESLIKTSNFDSASIHRVKDNNSVTSLPRHQKDTRT